MRAIWTAGAKGDLAEIITGIWYDNPGAAKRIRERIQATGTYLSSQPFMGRTGAINGTREAIPHPSYRIVYQVNKETVSILAVVHTARQWPPVDEAE